MKNVLIYPSRLSGKISVPPSKSICHRAIICAGLSKGVSIISNVVFSEDVEATLNAVESFGAHIVRKRDSLIINGTGKLSIKNSLIDCNESGSTLRFLIPLAAVTGERVVFTGRGRLAERPLMPYYEIFDKQNINYSNTSGRLPLLVEGKLMPGEYKVKGNISSQFITGLLFALPLLNGDSRIVITTPLESKSYVDLTIEMLKRFKVETENHDYSEIIISGNQLYNSTDYHIEGDFSQAAFFLAADILGADVLCQGLNMESLQGDKAILDIIISMGGKLISEDYGIGFQPSKPSGITIDVSQCPDIVPILSVIGALSNGTTRIINAGRLRIKESDRLRAIGCELNKIGADVKEMPEGLIINGRETLEGGIVSSWNDHRIAMALAIASIKCRKPLIIKDADCVKKSYPDFWEDFKMLGGNIYEWNMGR